MIVWKILVLFNLSTSSCWHLAKFDTDRKIYIAFYNWFTARSQIKTIIARWNHSMVGIKMYILSGWNNQNAVTIKLCRKVLLLYRP